MKWLLAIDPGVDTGHCLLYPSGKIASCGLGFPTVNADVAVLERPQVYRKGKQKGDPNDLITLAIQLGRYVEALERNNIRTKLVLPTTWKGQVPKEVHHRRVIAKLDPFEAGLVAHDLEDVAEGKQHNVLDAVALAKWAYDSRLFW